MKRAFTFAASLTIALTGAAAHAADSDVQRIQSLLSHTYDRPGHKVEAAPVVVEQDFALADWIQGGMGGRALLRQRDGRWEIVACGGDGFKDAAQLRDAGLAPGTAQRLIAKLDQAEQSIAPERVRQFGLFGKAGQSMSDTHPAP
ncbi:copper uptake system-associated protein [Burkholderia gladioli]|uniref:Copper uptake system-associated protein n=1 Tax=Burkholderia gladioli (strain BSR3) TaxID=999541 RepID=F2LT75_BURGS|nr:copper uptake system-associated protein [Burkholderia gladioli]AEA66021.1 hypothetical protein bgla_4p2610 [Burkholderia gladioli BSR3]MBW5285053.1 copper uptake system-associated protein [Burkholderia gladioli]